MLNLMNFRPSRIRSGLVALGAALLFATAPAVVGQDRAEAEARSWDEILDTARGQTVYWNAWGGDERNNAFIQWVADEVRTRHGVTIEHVKLSDTAEAVSRVVAERAAGRDSGGTVDLIWINGPNFLAMKEQELLFGPFTQTLPNYVLVDEVGKPSNVVDFTIPVDGLASPWRIAQVAFVYDSARTDTGTLPRTIPEMGEWAQVNSGRLTHPNVRNFLGATFLKQALYELTPDAGVLQNPADDTVFAAATAPLWAWYDEVRPHLWRGGAAFPENSSALDRLLDDGEIDIAITLNPATAAVISEVGLLPKSARVFFLDNGTIGNTSFVAIPYNAAHAEGAMVVANFLLDPVAQARMQDPTVLGAFTVLDVGMLSDEQRGLFTDAAAHPAMPDPEEMADVLLEPHPSWMTMVVEEWERRYTR
jgi:putative thiamine transport system substrate-binding protein